MESSERGCVVLGEDGEFYELKMGNDVPAFDIEFNDPVAMRSEELKPIEMHPQEYIVYAYNAIAKVAEILLERGGGVAMTSVILREVHIGAERESQRRIWSGASSIEQPTVRNEAAAAFRIASAPPQIPSRSCFPSPSSQEKVAAQNAKTGASIEAPVSTLAVLYQDERRPPPPPPPPVAGRLLKQSLQ